MRRDRVDLPEAGGYTWWPRIAQEYRSLEDAARVAHDKALEAVRLEGVRAEGVLVAGGAVHEIVRACETHDADLLVMGAHSRGRLERALLGSVTDGAKNHVRASVLVARTPPPAQRVLAAVDGSAESRKAASIALRFARAWGAPTLVSHVIESPGDARDGELAIPPDVVAAARAGGSPEVAYSLEIGKPADRIVALAEARGAGLIVMGSRGLGRLRSLVAGSVSNRVAHEARASVLLVKGDET